MRQLKVIFCGFVVKTAKCEALVGISADLNSFEDFEVIDEDATFPWKVFFWDYVYPEVYRLTLAILVSINLFVYYSI